MTDVAPKPNPAAAAVPGGPPGEEPQGSLGAVLIGGAILLVAALLIFWPSSESASGAGADGSGSRSGGVQGSDIVGGAGQSVRGITPREVDPAEGKARAQPAFMAPNQGMTMMPNPKPEPTSFPSAAAEIAHFEKKLEQARANLEQRATFLERMKRIKDNAKNAADLARAESRSVIVQQNYDKAKQVVTDLEQKIAGLREKQAG